MVSSITCRKNRMYHYEADKIGIATVDVGNEFPIYFREEHRDPNGVLLTAPQALLVCYAVLRWLENEGKTGSKLKMILEMGGTPPLATMEMLAEHYECMEADEEAEDERRALEEVVANAERRAVASAATIARFQNAPPPTGGDLPL